jgi:hypothetical protein
VIYEIVILAMIAAFLGLRLYSVLGRRAEHEEESVPNRFDPGEGGRSASWAAFRPRPSAACARSPRRTAISTCCRSSKGPRPPTA